MDKKDIILNHKDGICEKSAGMNHVYDLLQLIYYIGKLEIGESFRPFTMKQINYLCNSNINSAKRYRTFRIPKKSGDYREISAPSSTLMSMLKALNILFECLYTPSPAAMGFTNGRSIVDNARVHLGMNYVLNLDLQDFFPSISQARVWARLQLKPFNFPKEIANVVAGLCCMKHTDKEGNVKCVLPQGAPTSPILTNAICDKLDRRLNGLAKKYALKYTRYADDITFSSMHSVYGQNSPFMTELYSIIAGQNFKVNENKTRLQKKGSRQEVTGIIVSDRTNVTKKYIRNVRILLHVWEKFGHDKAYARFMPSYIADSIQKRSTIPPMEEVLRGKIMYIKMVKGEGSSVYKALKSQYDSLMLRDFSKEEKVSTQSSSLAYVFSHPLRKFEEDFSTELTFKIKKNGKLYATFNMMGQEVFVAISKTVAKFSPEKIRGDHRLIISIAKASGKYFWIIRFPETKESPSEIFLNIPISELLQIWKDKGIDAAIKVNANGKRLLDLGFEVKDVADLFDGEDLESALIEEL